MSTPRVSLKPSSPAPTSVATPFWRTYADRLPSRTKTLPPVDTPWSLIALTGKIAVNRSTVGWMRTGSNGGCI